MAPIGLSNLSFNPRPRVGGDATPDRQAPMVKVSIHAPAWGATGLALRHLPQNPQCFNPRPRVGGDLSRFLLPAFVPNVSIHAPAWGATNVGPLHDCRVLKFQSTPPRGGRLGCLERVLWKHETKFQSTPPRGGRLGEQVNRQFIPCSFNPRPRVGGDLLRNLRSELAILVSIHAPAWGATRSSGCKSRHKLIRVSIHAPAWGATCRQRGNFRHP